MTPVAQTEPPAEALIHHPEGLHFEPVLSLTNPHHYLTAAVMDKFDALLIPGQHPALSRAGEATIRQGLQAC